MLGGIVAFQYFGISKGQNKIDKRVLFQSAIDKMNADYEGKYGIARNPYDPRFDPEQFDLDYYIVSNCMMAELLAKLFPVGTRKSFVDYMLIEKAGAHIKETPSIPNRFSYTYLSKIPSFLVGENKIIIGVNYDSSHQVNDVTIGQGSVYDYLNRCKSKIYPKDRDVYQ